MMYVKIDFEDKCDSVNLLFMQKIDNRLEYFSFLGSNKIFLMYFLTVIYIILVDCKLNCLEIIKEPFFI